MTKNEKEPLGPGASSVPQTQKPDKTGLLFLGGYFLLFCAVVLGAGAGWHAYREHVESARWPAVAAQLSDCHIHTGYDSWHGRARSFHSVECSFHYDVGDIPYFVQVKAGDTVSIVRGQINLTRPKVTLPSLQQWVKRHPKGAVETIHYDPAHPDRISLVGVDRDIKRQTTAGYARGAITFGVAGAGLLLLGTRLRRAVSRGNVLASALMVDDRLIAFSSTFALLCAVILARVVFMRQPRRLVLAGVTLLPGGASGWYILIAGPRDVWVRYRRKRRGATGRARFLRIRRRHVGRGVAQRPSP